MKAAFNILPAEPGGDSLSLLIEAGDQYIYFMWYGQVPFSARGFSIYNFPDKVKVEDIKTIFALLAPHLKGLSSVTICYNARESMLVPAAYNMEELSDQSLSLLFGNDYHGQVNSDRVTSADIHLHYRVPADIANLFNEQFPKAIVFHASSLQLELLNKEKDLLYSIFYHNSLKLILYKAGKLQIVQYFNYTLPEDAAYHLLNACEQFGLKASDITLRLSGMMNEHSKLHMSLCNYFLNISFESVADEIFASDEMKEFPTHFFSHLISLALCAS